MENGFLLIDKEKGLNSFKLVLALRKIFNQKKVGFAGTLDPLASGLMILALGEYTKLLHFLEKKDKTYVVTVEFGKISDTFDLEGNIEEIKVLKEKIPNLVKIKKLLKEKFSGEIEQIPPCFSAIKIGGERAYKLARSGRKVIIPKRKTQIYDLEILEYKYPLLVLKVHCSSGTYIRSLVNDLGRELGIGGLVNQLRRISIDSWDVKNSLKLEEIKVDNLIKAVKFLKNFDVLELTESQYKILEQGNFIQTKIRKFHEPFLGYFNNKLVGILELTKDGKELKFKRKFNIV